MLLIDDVGTRESLRRIASRLTSEPALREDLVQEGMIHLWLLEERRPGQTRSWYLQNCKYHLRNHLTIGCSVDSPKRRKGRISVTGDGDDLAQLQERTESDGTVLTQVSARDILSLLFARLNPVERAILTHLSEGLGAREIAARMELSHPAVIKHRRKIAALAIKLGVAPSPAYHRNNANGKRHTVETSAR